MFPVPRGTIRFVRQFVDGTLKGMTFTDTLSYPKNEIPRVIRSFETDIETGRVFGGPGFGSRYVITYAEVIKE
jgi:hypothetical protein